MNLKNIDLYLLAALVALIEERSVSRAAERMFMTQPAMSYALNRLRTLLRDPLLTRSAKGMQPTAKALALVEPLRRVMSDIEQIFRPTIAFNPEESDRIFHIAASDYAERVIVGPLLQQIHASPVSFQVSSLDAALQCDFYRRETFDLILGHLNSRTDVADLRTEVVLRDRLACLTSASTDNLANESIGLERYLQFKHIAVAGSDAQQDPVDSQLQPLGKSRFTAHRVSSYESGYLLARQTTLVLTLPARMATELGAVDNGLRIFDAPAEVSTYQLRMQWPSQFETDPAHVWLCDQVRLLARAQDQVSQAPVIRAPEDCRPAAAESLLSSP